jgi:hypothetical protein
VRRVNLNLPADIEARVLAFAESRPLAYDKKDRRWFSRALVDWTRHIMYQNEEPSAGGGEWNMDAFN